MHAVELLEAAAERLSGQTERFVIAENVSVGERLYHGTDFWSAQSIIEKARIRTDSPRDWGRQAKPLKRFYCTPSLGMAAGHLSDSKIIGEDAEDEMNGIGAILRFRVDSKNLIPDEDWIGRWAAQNHVPREESVWKEYTVAPDQWKVVLALASKYKTIQAIIAQIDDHTVYYPNNAPIGKKLIGALLKSKDGTGVLVRLNQFSDAHSAVGTLVIEKAWRIELSDPDPDGTWSLPWSGYEETDDDGKTIMSEDLLDEYGTAIPVPNNALPVTVAS